MVAMKHDSFWRGVGLTFFVVFFSSGLKKRLATCCLSLTAALRGLALRHRNQEAALSKSSLHLVRRAVGWSLPLVLPMRKPLKSEAKTGKAMVSLPSLSRVGTRLEVPIAIGGKLLQEGESLYVKWLLVDVSTGETQEIEMRTEGTLDQVLLDFVTRCAKQLVKQLGHTTRETTDRALIREPTRSTAAFEWFSRGLVAGNNQMKKDAFDQAIKLDPDFVDAHLHLGDTLLYFVNPMEDLKAARQFQSLAAAAYEKVIHTIESQSRNPRIAAVADRHLALYYGFGSASLNPERTADHLYASLFLDPIQPKHPSLRDSFEEIRPIIHDEGIPLDIWTNVLTLLTYDF
jgi:hypothetical protein